MKKPSIAVLQSLTVMIIAARPLSEIANMSRNASTGN